MRRPSPRPSAEHFTRPARDPRRHVSPGQAELRTGGHARPLAFDARHRAGVRLSRANESEQPMNRAERAAVIDRIAADIKEADAVYAVDYRGLSVAQAADL